MEGHEAKRALLQFNILLNGYNGLGKLITPEVHKRMKRFCKKGLKEIEQIKS